MIPLWILPVIAIPVLVYVLIRYIYTYWSRNGFPFLRPDIPWGCMRPVVVKQTQSFGERIRDLHLANPQSPFLGIYIFFRPALLIRDAGLVKRVLVNDFDHFHDRGIFYSEHA